MKYMLRVAWLVIFWVSVILIWTGVSVGDQGQNLYEENCVLCHGSKGDGKGPGAAAYNPRPGKFGDPAFWKGDVRGKIKNAVKRGKGAMEPVEVTDSELNAIIGYMEQTFKR